MEWGRTTAPGDRDSTGRWEWAGDVMWQRGTRDGMGGWKRQATAPGEWEASRHGVVNHGPTMGSLATGSQENALNSGTPDQWPKYT